MRKHFTLLFFMLTLFSFGAWAEDSTWSFVWDTSRSNGGEGFYNISDHEKTTQVETLNGLQWTLVSDSHAMGYTATSGQYFGSSTYPISHGTLSTSYLKGKIKKVSFEAKTKLDEQDVKISVSVNGENYGDAVALTTEKTVYDLVPSGDAAEGEIVITFDQTSETKSIIYFYSMSIVYEGEGIVGPVVEQVSPQLSYDIKEMTIYQGDGPFVNPLTNPYDVSPITYTSSDSDILYVGKNSGQIYSMGLLGTVTVTASFEGDDKYLPETATYQVNIIEKPVIPAPEVDVKGGTFTEPVTVTITSDDPLCKAIWYSTTLTSVKDMGYDDQTIIVPGNKATVVIDETCTLLCVAVGDDNIGKAAKYDFIINLPLSADFTAEESSIAYYKMGWDSIEEASTWKYYGINDKTWTLTEGSAPTGTPSFSSIDSDSQYSLSIYYSNDEQRERAVSPEMEIRPNSQVEFYACFAGIWLYSGNWKFYVNDLTDNTQDLLVNSFLWAQNHAFTGPSWEKFSFGLSKYAGHKCTFEFIYEGSGGEDVSIDGFKVIQQDDSEDAKIHIMQGQKVHFKDLSKGHPTVWEWTIEGAEPSTSNEQNPVVTFNKAGEYTVQLRVAKEGEVSTMVRNQYVIVSVESPKAHIGIPEGAYLSPWAYAYVPAGIPVTYKDESTGHPDTWTWTFEGTDVASSNEQNPTVTYKEEGRYGLDLTVSNSAGSDRDFLVEAIHAGGSEDVWNITPEETAALGEVNMGWYGSYGGSNWLGMEAFAEHFTKPMTTATIDNVTAYFANTKAKDENTEIVVSICKVGDNGMPAEALVTTSLKVLDLVYDEKEVVPTVFKFDEAITVDDEFFIVISGFPNADYYDNVSLLCAYRGGKGKNTAYQYLLDEDENFNLLDAGKWYANEDDPLSMCLTAHMTYDYSPSSIINAETPDAIAKEVYTIDGIRISNADKKGIYIIREGQAVRKVYVK